MTGREGRARVLASSTVVCLLGVLALGPVLWSRGYVLVADMTFVPAQPWKPAWLGLDGSVPRAVPADAVLSVLGLLVPGDLLQKGILLGILVLAGVGMLRLVGRLALSVTAGLGAAVLYTWNPYVFERLAIGHWGLLVGYAALPWVLGAALDVRRDDPRAIWRLVLLLAVASAGSPTGGLVAALVAVVVVAGRARRRATWVLLAAAVLVNLPWLAPALLNDAATSDGSGVAAFAARSDTPWGAWPSLVTFGGIWKQAAVPAERGSGVLVAASLLLVALSVWALVAVVRRGQVPAAGRLTGLALTGLVLAGVPAKGAGERLVAHLVDAIPGLGLWRDSQKWLMPFVLVACLGFAALVEVVRRRLHGQGLSGAAVLLALVPVVLLPSLGWGLSGRFVPVDYPAEWQTVRTVLDHQHGEPRIAVLPWSAYQRLPWNDRRAALDPAIRYFPGQVVTSDDLVVSRRLTVGGEDPAASRIGQAVAAGDPLGPVLATLGIGYLLVEKTAPSDVKAVLPPGTVLHDGPQLLLLRLDHGSRPTGAAHPAPIVAADVLAALAVLLAALLTIRRGSGPRSGSMLHGSSDNGGDADYT